MSGTVTQNPTTWSVDGNLISKDIGEPTSLTPFTASDCTLTLLAAVPLGGNLLVPLKVESNW